MKKFALIDENNIVINISIAGNDWDSTGWIEYNEKNIACIGYKWDGKGFAAPQPFDSWKLDPESYLWQAPTPMPEDGKRYEWDEATLSWLEITE